MFKKLYNQFRLVFSLEPVTGLLIKSGRVSFNPTRPDMDFVRTQTVYGDVPYLPGSSLKGVIRSHAERILRTLSLIDCDITGDRICFPQERARDIVPAERYREHCYACRTFGSTSLAGRLRLGDAYPWTVGAPSEEIKEVASDIEKHVPTEVRTNVRIDRRKGTAAGGGLFEAEVVSGGMFHGEITLVNYQLWQLTLLGLVIRDLNNGTQRLGAAKARGLGRVKITVDRFELRQYGPLASVGEEKALKGVGSLSSEVENYDFIPHDSITLPQGAAENRDESLPGLVEFFESSGRPHDSWEQLIRELAKSDHWRALLKRGENNAHRA